MPGGIQLVIADFTPDGNLRQQRIRVHFTPKIFIQLGNRQYVLCHNHSSVARWVSTATPMALSVEN